MRLLERFTMLFLLVGGSGFCNTTPGTVNVTRFSNFDGKIKPRVALTPLGTLRSERLSSQFIHMMCLFVLNFAFGQKSPRRLSCD
ncbi:hypothetical protein CDL12_03708 [Handroanthus impetiginosus]|uniref:Secreted protein n=1 Tax=Handroanthus impetiginosus TaxID=429701 RepID=A0A2G9I1D0_9LAMI|nr:hypothetical protein CDL12_03708 [Handroanthus impetiginosus]